MCYHNYTVLQVLLKRKFWKNMILLFYTERVDYYYIIIQTEFLDSDCIVITLFLSLITII